MQKCVCLISSHERRLRRHASLIDQCQSTMRTCMSTNLCGKQRCQGPLIRVPYGLAKFQVHSGREMNHRPCNCQPPCMRMASSSSGWGLVCSIACWAPPSPPMPEPASLFKSGVPLYSPLEGHSLWDLALITPGFARSDLF